MGAIFASGKPGQKAYSRWRSIMDKAAGKPRGLTGAALESAVRALQRTNPEYIVVDST